MTAPSGPPAADGEDQDRTVGPARIPKNGKLLYDAVNAELAALVGRAKDLLGIATISGTITGALLNDKLVGIAKLQTLPVWWLILTGTALGVIVLCALGTLLPRGWSFSPDACDVYHLAFAGDYDDNMLYLAAAKAFVADKPSARQRRRDHHPATRPGSCPQQRTARACPRRSPPTRRRRRRRYPRSRYRPKHPTNRTRRLDHRSPSRRYDGAAGVHGVGSSRSRGLGLTLHIVLVS